MQEIITRFIEKHKNKLPFLISIWIAIFTFIALDGFSRYFGILDADFLGKAFFNNRYLFLIPAWLVASYLMISHQEASIGKNLNHNWFLYLVLSIYIKNILDIVGFESWGFYVAMVFASLLVGLFVLVPICRLIKEGKIFSGKKDWWNILSEDGFKYNKEYTPKLTIFVISVVIGLVFLRFYGIEGLFPTTDEYLHLNNAKNLLEPGNNEYLTVEYTRFPLLNNLLVVLFKGFGVSIFTARFPGLFLGLLTPVLSYLLLRKENEQLSVIVSLLLIFSPWVLMLSKTIREYAYLLPIFFVWNVYIYKRVKLILQKEYKWKCFVVDALVLISAIAYIFLFDQLSTFKFGLIFYAIGFVYYWVMRIVENNLWKKLWDTYGKLVILLLVVYALVLVLNRFVGLDFIVYQINIIPSFNNKWIAYVFGNPEYGSLFLNGIFVLLGALTIGYKAYQKREGGIGLYALLSVLLIMYFYTFHFGKYFRPRYISIVLPWILIVATYGFDLVAKYLLEEISLVKKNIYNLVFLCTNWVYLFYSVISSGSGYVPVTQEFHESVELVHEYVLENEIEAEVLVTTLPDGFDWYFDDYFNEILKYAYTDEHREVLLAEYVQEYESGMFIIDERRNDWSESLFVEERSYETLEGDTLEFVERVDYYSIYTW